jgi:replicative DNA helicase Mcm
MGFMDLFRLAFPLTRKAEEAVAHYAQFLPEDRLKSLKKLLKQGKVSLSEAQLGVILIADQPFPVVDISTHDAAVVRFAEAVNQKNEDYVKSISFKEFSPIALSYLSGHLAEDLVGFDAVKEAVAIQLFATDNVHILLLGDPGTGKTEVLRAAHDITPISSFGLGSGVSGVGLTASAKGKAVEKGLLPMADKGLCCIDELNLIKREDVAGLYNAMEKGFVRYDKLGKHMRLDARVSLLATANPKYSQFSGKTPAAVKKEIPFDTALLTRFHIVFFITKHDVKEFVEIAKRIVQDKERSMKDGDIAFLKDYIAAARAIEVKFPKQLEQRVVDFAERIKKEEKNFLIEVSPRLVVGVVRMAKAVARAEMRAEVEEKDVIHVLSVVEKSLYKAKTI